MPVREYDPKQIEPKWQQYWEENKTFKTPDLPGSKKFYCLDMFPYPSGSGLHIGHPLGYTATDIYSRFKRMQGFDVLHPMGYDAFGLPAEQHAVATGEHPGRITEANCQNFTQQMKTIGFSYDWDREVKTCTADYYRWTQWIFLQIYNSWFDEEMQRARPISELPIPREIQKQGEKAILEYQADHRLAYIAEAMVNWCPALGTVLANEEVIDGLSERGGHEVVRKPMRQWMLRITKYAERLLSELEILDWPESIKEQQRNWIGKKRGAKIDFQVEGSQHVLTAFTTRPDTLFGVTFFVVSPEHPLVPELTTPDQRARVEEYCEKSRKLSEFARTLDNREKTGVFTGSFVVNPISGEPVALYVGDYVLMSYGTGAVMGVPAHDERDFDFARKFQIPIRPVICPEAEEMKVQHAVKDGEIAWTGPGVMLPNHSEVFVELELLAKPNSEAASEIVGWLEKQGKGQGVINYKLRDWLFSRQRYWGEPIPIVHWEDGTITALSEEELPLLLPSVEDYKPSDGGESPLAKAEEWLEVVDPNSGRKGRRETNTMPQWAGSCWYYLRFIDPHNDKAGWDAGKEKTWMNVDLYVGGAEHAVLHLLYARFWHKVLFDLGHVTTVEPFQKLFNQGMILSHAFKNRRGALVPVDEVLEDESGNATHCESGEPLEKIVAKMSKSLRNVINPDEVIQQYGADTLRMYLMFMGPLDQSRIWDSQAISGNARFLRKSWGFVVGSEDEGFSKVIASGEESEEVKKTLHQAIKKVTEDLEGLRFNTAISALMECLNTLQNLPVAKDTLESFVKLLAPFAPHLAEELWQRLGHSQSLVREEWPQFNEDYLKVHSVPLVIQINGKKRGTCDVPLDADDDMLKQQAVAGMANSNYPVQLTDKFIVVRDKKSGVPKLLNVIQS
ncbi:MAG: leucine--tRNA ligase [Bdellovibrionales bacterium]|nr:leucine--tRNA ligase [Bdellovibrionales bacterium]